MYLQRTGLLSTPLDAKAVASFMFHNGELRHPTSHRILRSTEQLRGSAIGNYLGSAGGKSETSRMYHHQLLQEYTSLFNFSNLTISQALRNFLTAFHLPGESQIIDRIMMSFAKVYIRDNSGVFGKPIVESPSASLITEIDSSKSNERLAQRKPCSKVSTHRLQGSLLEGDMENQGSPAVEPVEICGGSHKPNPTTLDYASVSERIITSHKLDTQNDYEGMDPDEQRIKVFSENLDTPNQQTIESTSVSPPESEPPLLLPDSSANGVNRTELNASAHSSPAFRLHRGAVATAVPPLSTVASPPPPPLRPSNANKTTIHANSTPPSTKEAHSTQFSPSNANLAVNNNLINLENIHRSKSITSYSSTLSRLSELPDESPVFQNPEANNRVIVGHLNGIASIASTQLPPVLKSELISLPSSPVETPKLRHKIASLDSQPSAIIRTDSLYSQSTKPQHETKYSPEDAPYILSFACILLNTDLHLRTSASRNLPKMTKEVFVRNLRGAYHGSDFPTELLENMYDDIRDNPLPGEREGIIAPFYSPRMSGWLFKHGKSGLVRWKRRFFILSDGCLYYFLDEKNVRGGRPRCILPLEGVSVHPFGRNEIRILPIPPLLPFLTNTWVESAATKYDAPAPMDGQSASFTCPLEGTQKDFSQMHAGSNGMYSPTPESRSTSTLSSKRPKRRSQLEQILRIEPGEDSEILIQSTARCTDLDGEKNVYSGHVAGISTNATAKSVAKNKRKKQSKRASKQYVVLPHSLETPVKKIDESSASHAFYPSDEPLVNPPRDTSMPQHLSTERYTGVETEPSISHRTPLPPVVPLFSPPFSKNFIADKHNSWNVSTCDLPAYITVAKFLSNGELKSSRCPHLFLRAETEAERNAWLQALTLQLGDQNLAPHPSLYAHLRAGEQMSWTLSPRPAWESRRNSEVGFPNKGLDRGTERTQVLRNHVFLEPRSLEESLSTLRSDDSDKWDSHPATHHDDVLPSAAVDNAIVFVNDIQALHTSPSRSTSRTQATILSANDAKRPQYPILLTASSDSVDTPSTFSYGTSMVATNSRENQSISSTPKNLTLIKHQGSISSQTQLPSPVVILSTPDSIHAKSSQLLRSDSEMLNKGNVVVHSTIAGTTQLTEFGSTAISWNTSKDLGLTVDHSLPPHRRLERIHTPHKQDASTTTSCTPLSVPLSALPNASQASPGLDRASEISVDSPRIPPSPNAQRTNERAAESPTPHPAPSPHLTKLLETISATFLQRNEPPELRIDEDEPSSRLPRRSFLDLDGNSSDDQDSLLSKDQSLSGSTLSYAASGGILPTTDTNFLPISNTAHPPSMTPASAPWRLALEPLVSSVQLSEDKFQLRGDRSTESNNAPQLSSFSSSLYGDESRDTFRSMIAPTTLLSQLRDARFQNNGSSSN